MTTEFMRKAMVEAFKQKAKPTMFLSSKFQSPDRNKTDTTKIVIDVSREDEEYAIDVLRSTGGRGNIAKRFTTKEYVPPTYDEFSSFNENERLNRIIGRTEYDSESIADVVAAITDDQVRLQNKINRAIEKQASDIMFTGTVPLHNHDTIDFKLKSTHIISPTVDWSNSAGVPVDDMADGARLNRKDSKNTTDHAIFGTTALKLLFNNDQYKEIANFRRADRINVRPPVTNAEGATFHGDISIEDWVIDIWTYPQFYKVPEGFGLPNEGQLVPYVPEDKVFLGSYNARFDLYFAGIAKLVQADSRLSGLGFAQIPQIMRGDFHPYANLDIEAVNVRYGIKSAPLCVPTDVDSYCIFTVQ